MIFRPNRRNERMRAFSRWLKSQNKKRLDFVNGVHPIFCKLIKGVITVKTFCVGFVGLIVVHTIMNGFNQTVETTSKCTNGPYFLDMNEHVEGIGAEFQEMKMSLIMADALRVPWLGNLNNSHDDRPRDRSADVFGLSDPSDCDKTTLMSLIKANVTGEWQVRSAMDLLEEPAFSVPDMCSGNVTAQQYHTQFNLDKNTVIIMNETIRRITLNYCLWNPRARAKYYETQLREGKIPRPESEFWILAHFRMTDGTNTQDLWRNGWRHMKQLAYDAALYANKHPEARIFLLSDGSSEELYANFTEIIPNVEFLLDLDWTDALWAMANSNVLLGGTSAFFALGAHLCMDTCLIDVSPPRFVKFLIHPSVPQSSMNHKLNFPNILSEKFNHLGF